MKTFLRTFAVVLMAAAFARFFVPVPAAPYWWSVAVAGAVLGALRASGGLRSGSEGGRAASGAFLCDRCKYDHPSTCSRPERPNATRCPDYRARGA